jgi:hypothetical protein
MELHEDLLTGAAEIAAFSGEPVRKIYYWAKHPDFPVFTIGRTIYARRSELNARFSSAAATTTKIDPRPDGAAQDAEYDS